MTTEQVTPPAEPVVPAVAAPLTLETAPPVVPLIATPEPKDPPAPAEQPSAVEPVVYNPTGDAGLDMVLKFVGDMGYHPDNAAMKAAMEGDFSMLKAELATKGVKGFDAYIELGQQAFTRTRAATEARQAADRKAVEDEAGGAESWAAIQKWAAENADADERTAISTELAAGGFRARAAVAWLKGHYDRASGVSDDGPGRSVAVTKGAADNSGALSPREYAAAVAKARVGFKGDFENSQTYKQLQSRRMAYRG